MRRQKTITKYEPRVLDKPKDPLNSAWLTPCDDEMDPFDTPEEALEAGINFCLDEEYDPKDLVIAEVKTTYLKPSNTEIKKAVAEAEPDECEW